MPRILVTGSCGLIGSAVCMFFAREGFEVWGVDCNSRRRFFGPEGDTGSTLDLLQANIPGYQHCPVDITSGGAIKLTIEKAKPDLIVHCAAQPSHDLAARIPITDFKTNAMGTAFLLDSARTYCPESPFIFMSTNKVYGDAPNSMRLVERETRFDYARQISRFEHPGVSERTSVDQTTHSLFGASKLAADILVQEYGRYFGMPTCCLRGGCLTGPNHAGVELHGFLSYLIKCNVQEREYKIFGHKGKQVRDNIHSEDVARFMFEFWKAPRVAEVYNLGGGRENSCSILEAFAMAEAVTGKPMKSTYIEEPRKGDHICYYSDLRKIKSHYPAWSITKSLPQIFEEIAERWTDV